MIKGIIQALLEDSGVGIIVLRTENAREFSIPFSFGSIKNYRGQSANEMKIRKGSVVSFAFDEKTKSISDIDLGLPRIRDLRREYA